MVTISQAQTEEQLEAVRELMREFTSWAIEYANKDPVPAPTFDGLEEELANLPGPYAPPKGRVLLAMVEGKPAGCVCLKQLSDTKCELKRMYVRSEFRGHKIGWKLGEMLVDEARTEGYKVMILDSHHTMKQAHRIYEGLGFEYTDHWTVP